MAVSVHVDPGGHGAGFVQPLRAAAEAVLQELEVTEAALAIKLTDEAGIRALNRSFAGIDEPTDVLSFASGEVEPDSGISYLGDVVVCPVVAMEAAARSRHSLLDELTLLTVHGVLHLLGHDHDRPERKRAMWRAQSRILERLGSPVRARWVAGMDRKAAPN